jgi:hypothetical protein
MRNKIIFVWGLTSSGSFSMKYMYLDLLNGHTLFCINIFERWKYHLKSRSLCHSYIVNSFSQKITRRSEIGMVVISVVLWQKESIQHIFISCPLVKVIWRIFHISFNISQPASTINIFENWLMGVSKKDNAHIWVGMCALLWAMWNVWNNIVFNNVIWLLHLCRLSR